MRRGWVVVPLVAGVLWGLGCSDDGGDGGGDGGGGPDGEALAGPFGEAAAEAYEAAGADREEDFTEGAVIDGCFVLDGDAAVAVAEALGVDDPDSAEIVDDNVLIGPPGQQETLSCLVRLGDDTTFGVNAGTTTLDADQTLDQIHRQAEQNDEAAEDLEGEAPGLDRDAVVAVARADLASFAWVDGDFQVTVLVREQAADPDAGFQALSVAVDAVAAALGGA